MSDEIEIYDDVKLHFIVRQAEQDVLKNRIQELTEFKLNLEVQVKAVLFTCTKQR